MNWDQNNWRTNTYQGCVSEIVKYRKLTFEVGIGLGVVGVQQHGVALI